MIIAYNKKGGKNAKGAVEYLTENRDLNHVKILEGDPELTKQIINSNPHELKYASGIIAFEEKTPSPEAVKDIIEEWKKSTFAGLKEEQYNYLIVEHTDTERYHLHFVIPRIELTTGKSFNPHWHQEDQKRLLKLQEYLNGKHGLTSAFQQEKRELLVVNKKAKQSFKEQIHAVITQEITNGNITNADTLREFVQSSGITINRQGKDYITLVCDDEKIRLKGAIYGKNFKNIQSITEQQREAERENIPTTSAELESLRDEIDRLVEHKAKSNRERFKERVHAQNSKTRTATQTATNELTEETQRNNQRIREKQSERNSDILRNSPNSGDNRRGDTIPVRLADTEAHAIQAQRSESEVHNSTSDSIGIQQRKNSNLYQNNGVEYDTIRSIIQSEAIRTNESKLRAYESAREARTRISQSITNAAAEIRKQYETDCYIISRSIDEAIEKRSTKYGNFGQKIDGIRESNSHNIRESESHLQQVGNIEPTISRYARFKERVTSYIETAREYISNKYQDLKERYSKNFKFKQEDLETSFATQDTKKEILGKETSFKDLQRVQSQFDISADRDIKQEQQARQQQQQQREQSNDYGMSL